MKQPQLDTIKRVFVVAVAVYFCAAGFSTASTDAPPRLSGERYVITRDVITSAGVYRLTDILFLVESWLLSTTDGYTFKASPDGLTAWQQQQWVVLIDGQRADIDMFDAVNLNLLPVSVDLIDSVVVVETPHMYGGFFAEAGLIHFYTTRPRQGNSLQATLSGGNETGDPGPWRFTEYATPNIDSMGPDGSLTFALGRHNWRLRANTTYQRHYFTNFAIQRRTFDIIGVPGSAQRASAAAEYSGPQRVSTGLLDTGAENSRPGMHRYTGSIGLYFERDHSRHKIFWGYSRAVKYYLYSEPIGREVPMDVRFNHIGADGFFGSPSNRGLDYRLQFSSHKLSRHPNTKNYDYDWNRRSMIADAELFQGYERLRFALGGGYELRSIESRDLLEDNPNHFGKLFGTVELDPGRRVNHRADLMAFFTTGSPSLKVYWKTAAGLTKKSRLMAQLSYSQRSFAENGDLWYWASRGYSFPDSSGIEYTLPEEISKSNTGTADLTWRSRPARGLAFDVTGIYRTFSDLYFEKREYEYIPDSCSVLSATEVVPGNGGQLAGGSAELTWRYSPRLETGVYYRYLGRIAGDELFKDTWQKVPDHRASCRVTWCPADGFSIWGRIWYYSSTYWKEYAALEGAQCVTAGVETHYSPRVDEFNSVDVTLRKLFWRRRLAADLAVRNLFDNSVRYHPIGATFGLSFFFQLSFVLPAP
jgi:hypothetical protein